ncbi:MAG: alpha-amylase/4-alpha-glucanotransferase domain-containing protein [Candidatus Bipolaricaulota bacterium]
MSEVNFVLGVHCHQPVGNFPEVMEQAYRDAYLPFIEALQRYASVKAVLHYTGPLWEFFLREHPDFVTRLASLASAGRVELLGGGFYEPILSVIPREDASAQLERMRGFLHRHMGQPPQGAWIAERVWEPQLPSLLRPCGVRYLAVDDTHFHRTGIPPEQLTGPYITEDHGQIVGVFPISTTLRYIIPFRPVPQVLEHFREVGRQRDHPLLVLVDDGEKFGLWPHTKRWVYDEGWLDQFFQALTENSDWLRTVTLREAYEKRDPVGRVYLPTTSYFELGQWALPKEGQQQLARLKQLLGPRAREFEAFIAGGYWRGFLTKYPEANYMHKRMLQVSEAARKLPATSTRRNEALNHVWRAQSNDAYWHGLFGGVYLPHLRDAVWHHLLSADHLIREEETPCALEQVDLDADGHQEIVLRNESWTAVLAPRWGGTLIELSHMGIPFNFLNTIARRPEGYHAQVRDAATATDNSAKSIHELTVAKQPGLEHELKYDRHRRVALADHLLLPQATRQDLAAGREVHVAHLAGRPFTFVAPASDCPGAQLQRREELPDGPLTISKFVSLSPTDGTMEIHWELTNPIDRPRSLQLGAELNLALLAGDAPDRYLNIPGRALEDPRLASAGEETRVRELQCVNEWDGWTLLLEATPEATLWRYPVQTVNNSESGFELVYQATCLIWVWKTDLPPGGHWHGNLRMKVERPG